MRPDFNATLDKQRDRLICEGLFMFSMSKHRTVNTHFWDDSYIETLNPFEMLLFLFLITNPQTNIAGVYEITVKRMHERTRIPTARIIQILEKFEADGKFIYKDNVMLAVNGIAHQKTDVPTIKTGIETIVSKAPRWVKDRVCIDYEFLSHLILIPSNTIPSDPITSDAPASALDEVMDGLRQRFNLNVLRDEQGWSDVAIWAFSEGFSPIAFLECFDLLARQKWRKGRITPKNVGDNLPDLDKLKQLEIEEQNGSNTSNGRKRTDQDVIAESADFYENYPS